MTLVERIEAGFKNIATRMLEVKSQANTSELIKSKYIGSATAQAGASTRVFTHTVLEDGLYLIAFSALPHVRYSGDVASIFNTSVGSFYGYGNTYNGTSLTRAVHLTAGDIVYMDVYGSNNQTNVLHHGYATILKI